MLDVEIALVPFGNYNEKKSIAKILIARVGGNETFFNYAFTIYEEKPIVGLPIWYSGIIKDYYRSAPVIDLLHAVLEAYKGKNAIMPASDYEKEIVALLEEKAGIYGKAE